VNKGSLSATITARVFSANPGIAAEPTTPVTTTGTAGEPAAAS
jgi:phage tail protein X